VAPGGTALPAPLPSTSIEKHNILLQFDLKWGLVSGEQRIDKPLITGRKGKRYFGSMICNGPLSEAFCQAGNGVGHGGSTIAA
jgi:hypothetical protein